MCCQRGRRSLPPTQPTDAPAALGTAVYPASYGSGNLIDHGGPANVECGIPGHLLEHAGFELDPDLTRYGTIQQQISAFVTAFSDVPDYTIIQQVTAPAR